MLAEIFILRIEALLRVAALSPSTTAIDPRFMPLTVAPPHERKLADRVSREDP